MRKLPLSVRLALAFLTVGVVPLAGLAWVYVHNFEQALSRTVLQHISSLADKKVSQVDDFINERLEDAQALGRGQLTRDALRELRQAPDAAAREAVRHVRQPELAALILSNRYHDLLLIDASGEVVLSLRQEADLGTNLLTGPFQQTGLAHGFRQAMASLHTDLTPFEPYAPSANKVAGFIVVPVLEQGRPVGALALQLNADAIAPVVADRTGLGHSGETVVAQYIGERVMYTGQLRRAPDLDPGQRLEVRQMAEPMQQALQGGNGRSITRDYSGERVAAAWRYLPALRWGMVVKIDADEAFAPVQAMARASWLVLGLFLLLSGATALVLGRRMVRTEILIADKEARYRAMFGSMNDGVALYWPIENGTDFVLLDFNTAAERITRLARREVLGRRATEIFPGLADNGILAAFRRVAATGETETVSLTRYADKRLSLWVENDVMRLPGGEILSVFKDITARKEAEEGLRLYANIFEHSGEAILVTDSENRIVVVNPAFERLTGYTLDEVRGLNPSMLASGHTSPEVYQTMWASLRECGFWQGELWDRHKSGAVYPKWAVISAIRDADGQVSHYIASFTDISERKAAEERIAHLAHHDTLTGLLNRYSLENRLAQAILSARRERRQLAVLFIDMDRFKVINDTLGHHAGDLLLVQVARRLRQAVRESDIVARQGGDEFVVVLTSLEHASDSTVVASKILQALAQPYQVEGQVLHSTPSIGISLFPQDGDDVETLMKNADAAMYHAKQQGRNNVQYFTAALNAEAGQRLELERDLRQALAEGQFMLHYQPQVRARDGRLVGVEALVRWQHPTKGMVSPMQFIPIAEEIGLIEPLGRLVLDEACRQLARWRTEDPRLASLRMAVNLSAQQLSSTGLVEMVRDTLARHGLGQGDLELEVTESVAMRNPAQAISQLQGLRALGVQLAIDDFGTGYSSLAYLKRLPIQVLKLDREFVRDVDQAGNNNADISAATLALAHNLGLHVVAEGVETPGQRAFLLRHHCDFLQGYGIGRPMPGDVLSAWLDGWEQTQS